jgi:hypothetical protein
MNSRKDVRFILKCPYQKDTSELNLSINGPLPGFINYLDQFIDGIFMLIDGTYGTDQSISFTGMGCSMGRNHNGHRFAFARYGKLLISKVDAADEFVQFCFGFRQCVGFHNDRFPLVIYMV